jgi:hypothetical protein
MRILVDVASDSGRPAGRLILLGELALAGELDGADGDGRVVGVARLQRFPGGDDDGCSLDVFGNSKTVIRDQQWA